MIFFVCPSRIRFKDPEPNVYMQRIFAVKRFGRRRKPRTKSNGAATATAVELKSSLSRSRSRSKVVLVEDPPVISVEGVSSATDDSSASDSSASSSPILSYSNLASDPIQSTPATSAEHSPDSAPPSPELDGRNALGLSPELGGGGSGGRKSRMGSRATSANSSTSSLVSLGMTRQRAGSVGVDGPLVELEESPSSEEEEANALGGTQSGETSEDEVRSSGIRRRNLPKGGPAFGFTEVPAQY